MNAPVAMTFDLSSIPFEQEASVEETVEALLDFAIRVRASDLFLLSDQESCQTSVRHMGLVRNLRSYSSEYGRKLLSHVKVLAGMDISDRFHPAEGRWLLERDEASPVDVRVNSIPTAFGEDITCRILDREFGLKELEELGLIAHEHRALVSLLRNSSGLILISGPTGSGKTTTMYSCLQHLNDGRRKINTLEDPIEYIVPGIRQSQINPRKEVDFASLLAGVLRQAPDVIMIGEIRDSETAQTAVRAANSGHLVLATLHAPSATSTIQSMLALDVNRHFLATSLLGVISQRLIRKLCQKCRHPIDLSTSGVIFDEIRQWLTAEEGRTMYSTGKCEDCLFSGYESRMCLCEILTATPTVKDLLAAGESARTIERTAIEAGMIDFRRTALTRVARGETTTEEMFRVIPFEHGD